MTNHRRSIRRLAPVAATAAALLAGAAQAPGAQAATTCTFANATVTVRMTQHDDSASLAVANNQITVGRGNSSVPCTGGTPTTGNTDAVLVVDESDDGSTPAPADGTSRLGITDPISFGPGKTVESNSPADSEIEFFVDTAAGYDHLNVVAGAIGPADLVLGNEGISWNRDADRDVMSMPFDQIIVGGRADDDSIDAQGGRGTGPPLSTPSRFSIVGGRGDDRLRGSDIAGGDSMDGGEGDDAIQGGGGQDMVYYSGAPAGAVVDLARADAQDTGLGRDTLSELERVTGSPFADTLRGDAGHNVLDGLGGDDVIEGRGGLDDVVGGPGTDTASFADSPGAATVDLAAGKATQGTETDLLLGVESAIGSRFADSLTGSGEANGLVGGPGPDTVAAGAGADRVEVRDGEGDRVSCGADADAVTADQTTLEAIGADCETVDALPEPAPVPATGGPTVTPAPTLSVTLTGARSQRLLRQKAVRAKVRCSLACTIAARAGAAKRVQTTLEPGVARKLKFRLSRRRLATLRRALAAGKRPSLRVEVEARDAAGTRVVRTLRVRAVRK